MALPGNITPPTGAWKLVKEIVADTVGPMAVLAAAAGSFVKASAGAAMNAQKMQQALAASEGAARVARQFETLLGSAAAARRQVEMLAKATATGAFSFESLAEASKNLQVLTDGALNSERALKRVQDVAAATGAPVDQMATAVADLYSSLKDGSGVEQAAEQLKRMGGISDQTAEKLKGLSQSGVGLATTWQVVEADLKRANGAAAELGGTISGLQQQLASIQQGSDTKIGQMFEEGEKAGLRAAIGFQKFGAAVAEANAGPWASLMAGVNSLKEAIGSALGRLAETGAVKTAFEALAVVAIAALGGINLAIVALLTQLPKLVSGLMATRAAALAMGAATKGIAGFAALLNPITVGLTALVAVLGTMAVLGAKAAGSIKQLGSNMREFQGSSKAGTEKVRGMVMTVTSPEERAAAEKEIEKQIANAREGIEQGKAAKKQALEDQRSADPYKAKAGRINEVQADNMIASGESALQGLIALQQALNEIAQDGGVTAYDQRRLDLAKQRVALEAQIAEKARGRIQGSATPEAAKKLAVLDKEQAQREYDYALAASEKKFADDEAMSKSSTKFQEKKQDRDDYLAAMDANKKLLSEKETLNGMTINASHAEHSKNKEYQANRKIINQFTQKYGESGAEMDYSGFDASGMGTKSGKLQMEIAKRQAMKEEWQDASAKGDTARRDKVEKEMANLVNPLTGQLEDGENWRAARAGDGEALRKAFGEGTSRLQTELETATADEDVLAKRAKLANKTDTVQIAAEAEAADKAAVEAAQRKAALEQQVAALEGREGGGVKAAQLEKESNIADLDKRIEAAKKLEAAEERVVAVQERGGSKAEEAQAVKELDAERVAAAGAGVDLGSDTSDSLQAEKAAVEQITQLRLQQAAIDEAAAKSRRDAAMQELKLRQQMVQLRFGVETGTGGGGPSESALKIADEQKTRARAEEARKLVRERDTEGTTQERRDELDRKIAGLGFGKETTAQDLDAEIADSRLREGELRTDQIAGSKNIAAQVGAATLVLREKYASSPEERQRFKAERERVEDEEKVRSKTAEYSKVMDVDKARDLATKETELDRLSLRAEEAGTPRVDSLTAVGGGATGFIGPAQDYQKSIAAKATEIAAAVANLTNDLKEQTRKGDAILSRMNEY